MKRHRIRLRRKAVERRRGRWGRGAAFLIFATLVGVVALQRPWRLWKLPPLTSLPGSAWLRVEQTSFAGLAPQVSGRLEAAVAEHVGQAWGLGRSREVADSLLRRYEFLLEVTPHRLWSRREVRFDVVLRRPVARTSDGRLLDARGRLYSAPEGVFAAAGLPQVALEEGIEAAELAALGNLLAQAARPGALPARLVRFDYETRGNWRGRLADQTRLRWGRLRWTREKLKRLNEVLADASSRFSGALSADLRYFEDGRILIRPEQ